MRPWISTLPLSGRSRPAIRRSVVVLPAPVGPSSTTNSPFAIESERLRTASTAPKLLLTSTSATSAMPSSRIKRRGQRLSAHRIKQGEPIRPQREPHGLADIDRLARRQPRLDLAASRRHRDDLRRTQIFGADHAAAQAGSIGERDVLGPHPERKLSVGPILEDFGHFHRDAIDLDAAIAAPR